MTTPKAASRKAARETGGPAVPRAVHTELKSQLPYWMRWLPMNWFRDLVLLIHEADPKPSAMALGPLGARNGILLRKDGEPLSESVLYHYRMALRHLAVVEVKDGQYWPDYARPEVQALIRAGRRGDPLAPAEKDALASLVVQNDDCRKIFLRLFARGDSFTLPEIRQTGSPCFIYYPEGTDEIVAENPTLKKRVRYQTANAQHASIWGVRTWCLQLDILDELYLPYPAIVPERRHMIFPVDPSKMDDASLRHALQEAVQFIAAQSVNPALDGRMHDPRTFELLELLARVCPNHRVSARAVKQFLLRAADRHPTQIELIPAPPSERPVGTEMAEGHIDRLHHKGWIQQGSRWYRKLTIYPSFLKR